MKLLEFLARHFRGRAVLVLGGLAACATGTSTADGIDASVDASVDAAPDAAPEADAFQFQTISPGQAGLTIRTGGHPLARARVTIRVADDSADGVPEVLLDRTTLADGRIDADLVLRPDTALVEVTVAAKGYIGPYDEPARRGQYGAFAPAAWIVVAPDALHDLSIDLTKEP